MAYMECIMMDAAVVTCWKIKADDLLNDCVQILIGGSTVLYQYYGFAASLWRNSEFYEIGRAHV